MLEKKNQEAFWCNLVKRNVHCAHKTVHFESNKLRVKENNGFKEQTQISFPPPPPPFLPLISRNVLH